MAGYSMQKDEYLRRLSRIEGQIRGLQKMVENDTYCIDVLTQLAAATKALQSVGLGLVDQHLRHCVSDAVRSDADGGEAKLDEAMSAVERLLRT